MASIGFYGGGYLINNGAGSGVGFYGSAFGDSVAVGSYQGKSYITNAAGTSQGPEINNVKYYNAGSGVIGAGGSGVPLKAIPNYQATLNIRFTNDTAIKVQNAKLRIYDRSNINNGASGVTTKVAELIHPDIIQTLTGSGDDSWITPVGSSVVVDLANSPGCSGQYAANGTSSNWYDSVHDWYLAISASPDSIGSKTNYGLYVSLEYL